MLTALEVLMNEDILKYVATKHDLEDLRDEFRQSQDVILSRLDEIVTTVRRLDQERLFTCVILR
ncbi:hypothetical protein [Candidatus Aquicultor secundus]|uniref:hypothetical protein n=2 Tax=Candidatus Aquicultor secundus TaxID=1973895 RepID=UPI0025794687|nr:hypothetical protein [Candidatus Aquicultor secundus]